jgi:hypothetical protein
MTTAPRGERHNVTRVIITDKLASYGAAKRELLSSVGVSYPVGNRLLAWSLSEVSVFNRLWSALRLIVPSLALTRAGW